MQTTLNNTQQRAWLRVHHALYVNPRRYHQLLKYFKTPENILNASVKVLSALKLEEDVIERLKRPPDQAIEQELRWAEQPQHHILLFKDAQYPALLKEIFAPPLILYAWGQPEVLQHAQIAIVGSRKPTPMGRESAHELAYQLARHDLTITSGMAIGIDGAAHRGALAADGLSIAVLGSGLRQLYPHRHRKLAHEIAQQGVVISEFPLHFGPLARNFPQRNRIIAGLSRGTVVVEAAVKSGSLLTAYSAINEGREVFAVPGSIHSSQSEGCHQLIKQGAKLTTTIADIVEEISPSSDTKCTLRRKKRRQQLDGTCQKLLDCVGFSVTSIDQVVMRSGISLTVVQRHLVDLEIKGLILSLPGGYARVTP